MQHETKRAGWTPGPLKVRTSKDQPRIVAVLADGSEATVARITSPYTRRHHDARFFAAAPDMAAELGQTVEELDAAVEHLRSCPASCLGRDNAGHWYRDEMLVNLNERASAARAALAKARGAAR